MTATQMARQLGKFGIHPTLARRGDEVSRGYDLADFKDAFDRYTPLKVLHPLQVNKNNNLEDLQGVTKKKDVTPSKPFNHLKSLECNTCNTLSGDTEVIQTSFDEWRTADGR